MLWDNQKAFNLKGEALPVTHLLKHEIKLEDPQKKQFLSNQGGHQYTRESQ